MLNESDHSNVKKRSKIMAARADTTKKTKNDPAHWDASVSKWHDTIKREVFLFFFW